MKAITSHRYSSPDVLGLEEVGDPVAGDGEVLVRMRAVSVNPRDWHLLRGLPYVARPQFGGLRRPRHRVLGSDLAGRVEAVGKVVITVP
jgi:NADPH:quinone reductase-like Zn-dependent oxidoreductase